MATSSTAGDSLQYCTPEELAHLDERFEHALRGVTCLVFWTGVGPDVARCWAMQHNLPTLTIAMGPLWDNRHSCSAGGARSSKAFFKYMKGASIRFAEYACRDMRQAIVLTNSPPQIYSTREHSNYRDLEEPVLKGALGRHGTTRIEYVHPTVSGAAAFQYQTWPHDTSNTWSTFLTTLWSKKPILHGIAPKNEKTKVMVKTAEICVVVVQLHAQTCIQQATVAEKQGMELKKGATRPTGTVADQKAQQKQVAKRQRANVKQKMAKQQKKYKQRLIELEEQTRQKKNASKLKRAELEQQLARVKREGRQKRAELERRIAQAKKEAKKSRAGTIVPKAPVKKELERQRATLEHEIAQQRKAHRRKQVEFEHQISQEQEAAKQKRAELEQQIAHHKIQVNQMLAKLERSLASPAGGKGKKHKKT
ncbi:hypothetical protein PV04_07010 [Phialophora macrospora]|uniref:Uncharacterized protein n=1 Tax=Phialophora macrospora TaxID=1851006 RepID=A0A0D2CRJ6_9EURO|nr:hypothetical protein PV04_07010 [Phialophora macrospora]